MCWTWHHRNTWCHTYRTRCHPYSDNASPFDTKSIENVKRCKANLLSWSRFFFFFVGGTGNNNDKHLRTRRTTLTKMDAVARMGGRDWPGKVLTFCPTFWRRASAKKKILAAWVGVADHVAFARVKLLLPAAVSSFHMETCVKIIFHRMRTWYSKPEQHMSYSGRHGCYHQHYGNRMMLIAKENARHNAGRVHARIWMVVTRYCKQIPVFTNAKHVN